MTATAFAIYESISAGLAYLLNRQAESGCWTEWALPPGSSSAWTTAYVGIQLQSLPHDLAAEAAPRTAAAARWLSEHEVEGGGWGYNEAVGADADSTACAVLLLAAAGLAAPKDAYSLLSGWQRADGGFATYPVVGPANSWNVSHPDVTPTALRALLTQPTPDRAAVSRGIEYVLRQRTGRGWWNSFWWHSPLYATAASLSFLDAVGIAVPPAGLDQFEPSNAFEAGLLILSLLYLHPDGRDSRLKGLAHQLTRQQLADGSWSSAPILRITRRDCFEPWASADPGTLYAEPNRLFTTATALQGLARVYRLISPADPVEANRFVGGYESRPASRAEISGKS